MTPGRPAPHRNLGRGSLAPKEFYEVPDKLSHLHFSKVGRFYVLLQSVDGTDDLTQKPADKGGIIYPDRPEQARWKLEKRAQ